MPLSIANETTLSGASLTKQIASQSLIVGLGLKPQHFQQIIQENPPLAFFEIHAENYFVDGGAFHARLSNICERYPLSIHGVGLSIGGESPIDVSHLKRLKSLIGRYPLSWFSEHLAWSSHGTNFLNDLLPVPYHAETLQRVCDHIDQIQSHLQLRMLLENPSTYVEFSNSTMSETEFINTVIQRTGCGLLLDINNVYVSCINHHRDPLNYVQSLHLNAVSEIHLAGFTQDADSLGAPLLIDSHSTPIAEQVWNLYEQTIRLTGPIATLIERDGDIPSFHTLLKECLLAQSIIESSLTNKQNRDYQ